MAQFLFDLDANTDSALGQRMRDRYIEAQVACLCSPTSSELVYYDWMFSDLLQYDLIQDEDLFEELTMRSLAHNLHFHNGHNAVDIIAAVAPRILCVLGV